MTARSEQAALEIQRRHVQATGSDDFDVPSVIRKTRAAGGLRQGEPHELYEVAVRAINANEDLTDEERTAAKARARAAVGL